MRFIYATYNMLHNCIDVTTFDGYVLRIDCGKAEKGLKTTPCSECALNAVAIDNPLEYATLYLEGGMRGCKKSCVYGEKSFLIGIRYVEIHCQISLLLCCRNSFLIIVLPVYLFLYTYIKFFVHQSGISRKEILCGRCPHPASRIRLDISGNTANADGIRPGHS